MGSCSPPSFRGVLFTTDKPVFLLPGVSCPTGRAEAVGYPRPDAPCLIAPEVYVFHQQHCEGAALLERLFRILLQLGSPLPER